MPENQSKNGFGSKIMTFNEEFLKGEIISGKRKEEFSGDSYPQNWLAEDYERRK